MSLQALAVYVAVPFLVFAILYRPLFGIIVYYFFVYFKLQNLMWGFQGIRISLIIVIVIIIGLLINKKKYSPNLSRLKKTENRLIIIFIFLLIISTLLSQFPTNSWDSFQKFIKVLVFALVVQITICNKKEMELFTLFLFLFNGFLAIRTCYLYQHFGEIQIEGYGFSWDNNDYALALVMFLPFVLSFFLYTKNKIQKILLFSLSLLIVFSIMVTFSRGGFLGLFFVLFLSVFILSRYKIKTFISIAVVILFISINLPKGYIERIKMIRTEIESANDMEDSNYTGRIYIWRIAAKMINDYPLFGVGPNNFVIMRQHYEDEADISVTHNSFLQIGAELGSIALLVFLLLLSKIIFNLFKLRRRIVNDDLNHWMIKYVGAILISIFGFIVSGFFLNRAMSEVLYLIISLGVCLQYIYQEEKQISE